jgi:hypothetical protein
MHALPEVVIFANNAEQPCFNVSACAGCLLVFLNHAEMLQRCTIPSPKTLIHRYNARSGIPNGLANVNATKQNETRMLASNACVHALRRHLHSPCRYSDGDDADFIRKKYTFPVIRESGLPGRAGHSLSTGAVALLYFCTLNATVRPIGFSKHTSQAHGIHHYAEEWSIVKKNCGSLLLH